MTYKRDMDLIREILIGLEAGKTFSTLTQKRSETMGYFPDQYETVDNEISHKLEHHLKLVQDVGFANIERGGHSTWHSEGLTWEGYKFLDTIRSEDIWQRLKQYTNKAGGIGFDVLINYAMELGREKLLSILSQ